MKKFLWPIVIVTALILALLLPNAVWLSHSTATVENRGWVGMHVRLLLEGEELEVGQIPPGGSATMLLAPKGEATLQVAVRRGARDNWQEHCSEYLEAGMYRVAVKVRSPKEVECSTDLPFLSRLFVMDIF